MRNFCRAVEAKASKEKGGRELERERGQKFSQRKAKSNCLPRAGAATTASTDAADQKTKKKKLAAHMKKREQGAYATDTEESSPRSGAK